MGVLVGLPLVALQVGAQESSGEETVTRNLSDRTSVTLLAGATLTSPSGTFPSLIFIDSETPTGLKRADLAETGVGYLWGINAFFPTGSGFGIDLALGSRNEVVRYRESGETSPIRMDLQWFHFGISCRYFLLDPMTGDGEEGIGSFGLALRGGLSLGFGPVGDRVESTLAADSAGSVVVVVDGSFKGGDPFCTAVGFSGGVEGVFVVTEDIEMSIGSSYTGMVTPVFSKDALPQSDLFLSHLDFVAGIGYRF